MTRLRELRESHGYTQEYVADMINVSRITYVRYEADSRQMKAPELISLAKLYHVSIDYLLGLSDVHIFDTKISPSQNELERAGIAAAAALAGVSEPQAMPKDIAELSALIQQIVDRALDTRCTPSDDQSA